MRTALDQAPRDPEIADADGDGARARGRARARRRAAGARGRGLRPARPAESMRYARFLMQDDRLGPAEGGDRRRAAPRPAGPRAPGMLGRIHLAPPRLGPRRPGGGDPARARTTRPRPRMATALEAAALRGAEPLRRDDRRCSRSSPASRRRRRGDGRVSCRPTCAAGDLAGARAYLDGVLGRRSRQPPAPADAGGPRRARRRHRRGRGRLPRAGRRRPGYAAGLPGALSRCSPARARPPRPRPRSTPASPPPATTRGCCSLKAGRLEAEGDIDGAIAVYETLYARDSASPLVANNLASLLSSHRADAGEPRARLRHRPAAARQPTCRSSRTPTAGSCSCAATPPQALAYLEPAAAALPGNALVQFHLGEAELALGDRAAAQAAFDRALAAAEAGSPLPQAATARARAAELADPAATPPSDD